MQPGFRALALAVALAPACARAWIYPEHRDIAAAGYEKLSPADRDRFDRLWSEARPAFAGPLCEKPSAGDEGAHPRCLDFAAFPALSGDHSCSPREVVEKVLSSTWILGVARVGAETKLSLATATSREERLNVVAISNLALQSVDPEYASRAGANNAHFLLPRASDDLAEYEASSLREGAPLNALGLYFQYHVAALALAQVLAQGGLPADARTRAARDALALEGFALHWLEDIYSSGHVVGTWGSDAWRKGTHDYYSEFGIDTLNWAGEPLIAFGDANMKPADLKRASSAVAASLRQFVAALTPGDALGVLAKDFGPGEAAIYAFDSCKEVSQPSDRGHAQLGPAFQAQVERMPIPGRGAEDVHTPRFREELGPFVGAFGTINASANWGGDGSQGTAWTAGLAAGARIGFGAEGITGSVGTGIAYLEVGLAMQGAQLSPCNGDQTCSELGINALFPRVPARTGLRVGMRLPFYVIPGDMLVLGPVLLAVSPKALSDVAVAAASGGLIPYEKSFRTAAGTFQVIAGREVDATFFGVISQVLEFVPIGTSASGAVELGVASVTSVRLNFPLVEWTPFRSFATQLTFATVLQLGFGVELPISAPVLVPAGRPPASPGVSWNAFLRLQFDGRFFIGSREDLQAPRG